jgi:multidrug resistance efflux pump
MLYSSGNRGIQQCKKDYDRFVTLFKQQSAPKELDDMTARYEMTKRDLKGQNKCEVLAQFNYSTITAPFSGVVTNTYVKEGDMATLVCLSEYRRCF